jgi:7,8-dihydropterin-6-yl-methyl-4-(beta-D-ribofuranosyl)aminobenzene 5'-phosphate synthase
MCTDDNPGHAHDHAEVSAAIPRPIEGGAVDPIALEPVDEVIVTTLVDNSYAGLMVDMGPAKRKPMGRTPPVPAGLFEEGATVPGMLAEHGFSALVSVRRGERTHTLLFDTGVSPGGMAENMDRLALDATRGCGGLASYASTPHRDHHSPSPKGVTTSIEEPR